MNRLKGKSILIGKDPINGRLSIVLIDGSMQKSIDVGNPHSVPNSVSRYRKDNNTGHCKIDIDNDGKMMITNLKPENVTFVDDIQVVSKKIDTSNTVTLGKDKYKLDLDLVLHTAIKMTNDTYRQPPQSKEYSINHLDNVWKEYEESIEAIRCHQQRISKMRLLPIMIGTLSTFITAICAVTTISNYSLYITIPIAAISFMIYLIIYFKKDPSIEEIKKADNKLFDNYICPNPKCGHFMGKQPYKILKQNKKCPYCGCTFSTK